jgi:Astacin (Peptidase family M12A)
MTDTERQLREALVKIAEVASAAVNYGEDHAEDDDSDAVGGAEATAGKAVCTPKTLPPRLVQKAAEAAIRINPVNAPVLGPLASIAPGLELDRLALTLVVAKYWGPQPRRLTVSFLESAPADLRARIISHLNAWTKTGSISFVETQGTGQVRISRGQGGYWSYLGTDITLIPKNRPTMNLEGFTMNTPESEFRRVVRHEAGHTLGFPHEHMRKTLVARIDPDKAYEYFRRTQGWKPRDVDLQVLTPLNERSVMGTPADQTSIMCYQLPGAITKDGRPILGGNDINQTDYAFIATIYPKAQRAPTREHADDWDEAEDVELAY